MNFRYYYIIIIYICKLTQTIKILMRSTDVLTSTPRGLCWKLRSLFPLQCPPEPATEKAHFQEEMFTEIPLFIIEHILKGTLRTESKELITDVLVKLHT